MEIKCSFTEMVDIETIVSHPRNSNNHPEKQIEVLSKLINKLGMRHPLIISKKSGFLVAGHGRLLALKLLGENKIPVDYQDFENEAEEILFLESDNHIAEFAQHDREMMFDNLKSLDIDLDDFNFEDVGIIDFSFDTLVPEDLSDKNKEIDTESFGDDLEHQCPKCGFEFNE